MQQADATRIAALCDQQIERLLAFTHRERTPEDYEIIFGLADLRNMYAGAPDLSELTPQAPRNNDTKIAMLAEAYGDGTPGNWDFPPIDRTANTWWRNRAADIEPVERETVSDELAGSITIVKRQPGETMQEAIGRTHREQRGETFGRKTSGP